jgi:hypothetical protein
VSIFPKVDANAFFVASQLLKDIFNDMKLSQTIEGFWLDKRLDFSEATVKKYRRMFLRNGKTYACTRLNWGPEREQRGWLLQRREDEGVNYIFGECFPDDPQRLYVHQRPDFPASPYTMNDLIV